MSATDERVEGAAKRIWAEDHFFSTGAYPGEDDKTYTWESLAPAYQTYWKALAKVSRQDESTSMLLNDDLQGCNVIQMIRLADGRWSCGVLMDGADGFVSITAPSMIGIVQTAISIASAKGGR